MLPQVKWTQKPVYIAARFVAGPVIQSCCLEARVWGWLESRDFPGWIAKWKSMCENAVSARIGWTDLLGSFSSPVKTGRLNSNPPGRGGRWNFRQGVQILSPPMSTTFVAKILPASNLLIHCLSTWKMTSKMNQNTQA